MADSENEPAAVEKRPRPRWFWWVCGVLRGIWKAAFTPVTREAWWTRYVVYGLFAVIVVAVCIPVYSDGPGRSPQARSRAMTEWIFPALKMYAGDHDGRFPLTLWELVPHYVSEEVLDQSAYPDERWQRRYEWLYFSGATETTPANTILLASPEIGGQRRSQYRVIIRADGSTAFVSEEAFRKARPDRNAPRTR